MDPTDTTVGDALDDGTGADTEADVSAALGETPAATPAAAAAAPVSTGFSLSSLGNAIGSLNLGQALQAAEGNILGQVANTKAGQQVKASAISAQIQTWMKQPAFWFAVVGGSILAFLGLRAAVTGR